MIQVGAQVATLRRRVASLVVVNRQRELPIRQTAFHPLSDPDSGPNSGARVLRGFKRHAVLSARRHPVLSGKKSDVELLRIATVKRIVVSKSVLRSFALQY